MYCQELTQSPVEQPASCSNVQSYSNSQNVFGVTLQFKVRSTLTMGKATVKGPKKRFRT